MDKDKKRSPILRGLFGVREKRSEEDSSSSSGFYGDGSLLFGALSNAQYGGMNIPALFACTQLISDGVASLPIVINKIWIFNRFCTRLFISRIVFCFTSYF